MSEPAPTILAVNDLKTYFQTPEGPLNAVDGVSFELKRGETLGIVGESGSGKSVVSLSLLRLVEAPGKIVGGRITFDGVDVLAATAKDVRRLRGRRLAMIFQDPMTSLNPYLKIGKQLTEITRLHLGHSRVEARRHAIRMLEMVGIPDADDRIGDYPHQFSGGMRQRVMIAMALSCEPEVLIADEPTTALDVTIQAQILELVKDLTARMGTSVILITHDLGIVAGVADTVVVMYAGRVFERATTMDIFAAPANPYTKALLRSMPRTDGEPGELLYQIPGLPPDGVDRPPGCPFAPRCDRVEKICRQEEPPFTEVGADHYSLCHFAEAVHNESKTQDQ
ncbi:MAG TPA: ABC transporter ATP-binding protein [Pyrinomonadaceae bacterium]|nr:ABC transporter ATP-binding protein [Pyrinomonadaceae bacterium]